MSQSSVSFSQEQIDVICCVEQLWWEHGQLPTNEKISQSTGVSLSTVKKYWTQEHFRSALMHRGVDINPERSAGLLTLLQLTLANLLLNVHDTRSVREKLGEVGVTSQQYHAWLRQPAFQQHLAKRGEEMFKAADWEAYEALVGAVRTGDVSALKLFFEMRNIYTPRQQIDVNIDVVLVRVVEVIARHVHDPVILNAIAAELDEIDVGGGKAMPAIETVSTPVVETPSILL